MPNRMLNSKTFAVALCLCLFAVGCDGKFKMSSLKLTREPESPKIVIPTHIKGTVAEYANLVGSGVQVYANGLVVGLGKNGSSEVPAHLRKKMEDYLARHGLGSARLGTEALTPKMVLRDRDTAVVLVGGQVPAGAPKGHRFDLYVTAQANTQTRSLDGGMLMPIDLQMSFGGIADARLTTHIWAKGAGAIFINPFVDPNSPDAAPKLLTGRIIGGGRVTRPRPLQLQIRRPDYEMADRIQRAIQQRFGNESRMFAKVAKARSRSLIELNIPKEYGDDFDHFVKLVMHLPVHYGSGSPESLSRKIAEEMEQPGANHDGLALIWEAMGRQVVPMIQKMYTSKNPATAFYAARAGLRLNDPLASDVVLRFATSADSAYQVEAIREFGRARSVLKATSALRLLLNDTNERVRLAAYEALRRRRDRSVTTINVSNRFEIDIVTTEGQYTIYVTKTQRPRIVLFGRNMSVSRPVFFESPDELVTVNGFAGSEKMTVFRKISRVGIRSDPFEIAPTVCTLAETLGTRPRPDFKGNVKGLGLTYSQVVGVLYRMCKEGDIPARFVLQPVDTLKRIYDDTTTTGRLDMAPL